MSTQTRALLRILSASEATELITRKTVRLSEAEQVVAPILENVRRRGDAALIDYARQFDRIELAQVAVTRDELTAARGRLTPEFLQAIELAASNIREFARFQMPEEKWIDAGPGRRLGQVIRPLESIGAYIPAGRYPLPSTLLMTVIPAQVAGVGKICVASPQPSVEILGAASWLRANSVFRIGGAQAIAAFAFGTESVPKVDRIVGPGNIYVAAAKKLLAGETGIDFVAGPTEIVIIAEDGDPKWIAADMLAQAEHDTEASSILLTTSRALAEKVALEVDRQLDTLSTAAVAREAIRRNSAVVLVSSLQEAVGMSNSLAPEHLAIHDASLLPEIQHAGSVFVGATSPEAAGDYASGPNHCLPTSGVARLRGGLSAADFVKVISVQELTREALSQMAPAVTTLARAEGLEGHARSVEVRLG